MSGGALAGIWPKTRTLRDPGGTGDVDGGGGFGVGSVDFVGDGVVRNVVLVERDGDVFVLSRAGGTGYEGEAKCVVADTERADRSSVGVGRVVQVPADGIGLKREEVVVADDLASDVADAFGDESVGHFRQVVQRVFTGGLVR